MVRVAVDDVYNKKDTTALTQIGLYYSVDSKLSLANKKIDEYEQKYAYVGMLLDDSLQYLELSKEYTELKRSIEKKKKEGEELKQAIKEKHEVIDDSYAGADVVGL